MYKYNSRSSRLQVIFIFPNVIASEAWQSHGRRRRLLRQTPPRSDNRCQGGFRNDMIAQFPVSLGFRWVYHQ